MMSGTIRTGDHRGMATTRPELKGSAAAIFARLWESGNGLTVPVARHILKLGFGAADKTRMRELIERNREGKLTDEEQEELNNFVKIGDLLAILQSKARKFLKQTATPRNGHG
jgi:hypothetical protein